MRRVISLMIGDMNSSHSGIGAGGAAGPRFTTGRLGVMFDAAEYARIGRLRISEIIPLGPVDLAKEIKLGDYLLAVDGTAIGKQTNLDELLENKVGRRVELDVSPSADGAGKHTVAVESHQSCRGCRASVRRLGRTESCLCFENQQRAAWIRTHARYVAGIARAALSRSGRAKPGPRRSGRGRSQQQRRFRERVRDRRVRSPKLFDDDRARLAVFSGTYATGPRVLEHPTILVTNEASLSDAEDFTEGYRTLHLGKVIGEPTAGWIIYTSNVSLIDGSSLRIPFIRVQGHDGTDMELHPRPVDIEVARPFGETYAGKDSQLDAAVKELLSELAAKSRQ